MTTRFDKTESSNNSLVGGYEGQNFTSDHVIPSCGLEDVDKAVFNLFDNQIPLYYDKEGEQHKVPVIFATGERFAILRRKKPLQDKTGALILPLISITRSSLENVPQKGMSNNQMFPHILKKRLSQKDLEHRQSKNIEGLENGTSLNRDNKNNKDFLLNPRFKNNVVETIEIPPIKYFGVSYEVTIWSSFTQQMNRFIESIMSAYTINPGQQFKIESPKGYWFPAFIDSSFSMDASYEEFTDSERYIKYTFSVSSTGYLILPNIKGGKTALRSFLSAPQLSFDIENGLDENVPNEVGIEANSADADIFDVLMTEDGYVPSQMVGVNDLDNALTLVQKDKSKGFAVPKKEVTTKVAGKTITGKRVTKKETVYRGKLEDI